MCSYRARNLLLTAGGGIAACLRWPWVRHGAPSLDCFPTGKDGVLYPPGCLHPGVIDAERFLELAPIGDDIWFKVMALRMGTLTRGVPGHRAFPLVGADVVSLFVRCNLIEDDANMARVFAA